jgi:hypothetical protein
MCEGEVRPNKWPQLTVRKDHEREAGHTEMNFQLHADVGGAERTRMTSSNNSKEGLALQLVVR